MADVEFRIEIQSPIALTLATATNVVTHVQPRWRINRMELRRLDANLYECKVGIDERDVSIEDHRGLIALRDAFLALLALVAMVPVKPRIKGTFTFQQGANNFAQLSLGPMDYTFPESQVLSFAPLIEGLAFGEAYRTAAWFIWQAINENEAVHRFLNLALAYELIVGVDSQVEGSKAPRCGACRDDINECPHCARSIRIPTTLRERAGFLFEDAELLSSFIEHRNRMFHGGVADCIANNSTELTSLNTNLLVNIRNYLGRKLGLADIRAANIGPAVNVPDITATLYYTTGQPPVQ